MPRVKRGHTVRRAKRKRLLSRAKGYYLNKSKLYRESESRPSDKGAQTYAFVGRRNKKRDFQAALDRPYQRRRPRERVHVPGVDAGPQSWPISPWTASTSRTWRCSDGPRAFTRIRRTGAERRRRGRQGVAGWPAFGSTYAEDRTAGRHGSPRPARREVKLLVALLGRMRTEQARFGGRAPNGSPRTSKAPGPGSKEVRAPPLEMAALKRRTRPHPGPASAPLLEQLEGLSL